MADAKKKPKRPFQAHTYRYGRYNPAESGYGDEKQWKAAFEHRMGWDEANTVLQNEDAFSILGLKSNATQQEIKAAYRKLAMQWHPDRHNAIKNTDPQKYAEAETMFKKVQAAYTIAMWK